MQAKGAFAVAGGSFELPELKLRGMGDMRSWEIALFLAKKLSFLLSPNEKDRLIRVDRDMETREI